MHGGVPDKMVEDMYVKVYQPTPPIPNMKRKNSADTRPTTQEVGWYESKENGKEEGSNGRIRVKIKHSELSHTKYLEARKLVLVTHL